MPQQSFWQFRFDLACGEVKEYNNKRAADMFVRLHKKKCQKCRLAEAPPAETTTDLYRDGRRVN